MCITLRDPDYLGYVYGIHASQSHSANALTTAKRLREPTPVTETDHPIHPNPVYITNQPSQTITLCNFVLRRAQYRPAAFLICACCHAGISLNSERGDFMIVSKSASLRYCSFLVGSTPAGRSPLSSSYEKVFEPGAT